MIRRSLTVLFALSPLLFVSHVARADEGPKDTKLEARARFDRGLTLFNDGDNAGALAEFERAYELIPNPVVLYNIGLVCAAMNRPVQASDALDRMLRSPGGLSADRLERARRTRDEQAARVAKLEVSTSIPATIEIDNVEVGKTPLAEPLRIGSGSHVVGAIAAGHAPARKEVTVAGGRSAAVELKLVPFEGRLAHVTVHSHLPAAEVLVDGEVVGRTPLASSLSLAPGTRTIEVRRAGYTSVRQSLTLGDGATGEVTLEPEEDPEATRREGGTLLFAITESQAMVTVDAKPRGVDPQRLALAPGLHRVRIERGGFEPLERDVEIPRAAPLPVNFVLDPTAETRASFVSKATAQRTWGWIGIAAGGAVLAGGLAYFAINQSSKNDAQAKSDNLERAAATGTGVCDIAGGTSSADECNLQRQAALDDLDAAKRRSTYALVAAGAGAVIAGVGVVILLTSDDPHRYDRKPKGEELLRTRMIPLVSALPGGGWMGLAGSF